MKRFEKAFGVFVIFAAIAALAGCASVRDVLTDSTSPRIAALETQNKVLAGQVMGLSAQAATKAERTEVAAVAGSVAETAKVLAEVKKAVVGHGQAIAEFNSRVNQTDIVIGAKLAAFEKRVVGIRILTAAAIGRIGILEDSQGYDHDRRAFRIGPFPDCKADELNKLAAGFEINTLIKGQLDAAIAIAKKESKAIKLSAGFADIRPFVDKKTGKRLEKSDELNSMCSSKRAEVVADYLKKATGDPDIKYDGRGTATRFGTVDTVDMNRSVLIYLERVRPVAVVPSPQAVAPAPASPAAPQK